MLTTQAHEETRKLVQLAAAVCEEKKGADTRILELDPMDSGLADFFLITSASNDRQATAIADEIELRLKREFGQYAHSVEGRRVGEWILLDYVDFVIHVFLAERRAFYDIERLRKSAKPFTPAEFDAELTKALAVKTLAARKKSAAAKPKKTVAKKAAAAKKAVPAKKVAAKKTAAKAVKAKPAKKAEGKKPVTAKKASPAKKVAAKKAVAAKKTGSVKKVTLKKAAAKGVGAKPATKAARKKAAAAERKTAKPAAKRTPPRPASRKATKSR
jgi:ribosome-associated protein